MIKVLFFAHLKDAAGQEEWMADAAGLPVAELKEKVKESLGIEGLDTIMTAVNEEFADDSAVLSDGDTVAFIPPVSGG